MVKVKRALISVADKTGLDELVKGLHKLGVEILSTGGTAKFIQGLDIPVRNVSDFTGFPEMLDGRVKTLHPKIHAALLSLRDNPEHMKQVKEHKIELIDLVVVNLYPFEKTVAKEEVKLEEAIENIDIGGPSMLRSAAKNYKSVAVVCNPSRYREILSELENNSGVLGDRILMELAVEVFHTTSNYDKAIDNYLSVQFSPQKAPAGEDLPRTRENASLSVQGLPDTLKLEFEKIQDLRYGENPHQRAVFYGDKNKLAGLAKAKQLQGKELSFNNIMDLNAALEIVLDFKQPAASIIKHNNPCGVAVSDKLVQAYQDALDCDRLSAFGSIVGLNRMLDLATAAAIVSSDFVECLIAPGYEEKTVEIFKKKKNLRLIEIEDFNSLNKIEGFDFKKVLGGLLLQDKDRKELSLGELKVVTKKKPSEEELKSLLFGWVVAKQVKSNAIVLTQGTKTVGIGAGQMSRVDSVFMAAHKAGGKAKGSCLASDAFFPKADGVETAARSGVAAIIQPGGSISDSEVIETADKLGISMVFTGTRHFKH